MSNDAVVRAYVRLKGLEMAIDTPGTKFLVPEHLVNEYHGALDHLEKSGFDVSEFRIPREYLDAFDMTDNLSVKKELFVAKLQAVLGYFSIVMQPQPSRPSVGFELSNKEDQ